LIILIAVRAQKVFELRVPPNAVVAPDLAALVSQNGGRITQQECNDFTVAFTHFDKNNEEKDSWVLGNRAAWEGFRASLHSPWLQTELKPGTSFSGPMLLRFKQELSGEAIRLRNIDDEDIELALQKLIQECESEGGYIRVQ
jgi:hypothetical protein